MCKNTWESREPASHFHASLTEKIQFYVSRNICSGKNANVRNLDDWTAEAVAGEKRPVENSHRPQSDGVISRKHRGKKFN